MIGTTEPLRLAGRNITLRPWHENDYTAFRKLQFDPELSKYQLWPVRNNTHTWQVFDSRVKGINLVRTGDYMSLAIVHQNMVIGEVGLFIRSRAHSQFEISWILLPEFRGHGYAQEAAVLLINYAFESLQVQKVVAEIDKRNLASLRLGLLLGFEIEGIHRSHRFVREGWIDVYLLGITRQDWQDHNWKARHEDD
jgi:aminoglycoside 6'-N-acetyltransferase